MHNGRQWNNQNNQTNDHGYDETGRRRSRRSIALKQKKTKKNGSGNQCLFFQRTLDVAAGFEKQMPCLNALFLEADSKGNRISITFLVPNQRQKKVKIKNKKSEIKEELKDC